MAHSHSFRFCKNGTSDIYQINCTSSGTVLQALQSSHQFTKHVNNQTFIIEREKSSTDGVIADHFPCHLITEGELLHIHTFTEEKDQKYESTKVKDEGAQDAEDAQKTKPASGELITFTVESKGGKDTTSKQIVRNKILKKFKTLGVYAYSEDTIKEALKRDGRFDDNVFDDRCKLHDLNDKTKLEISQNVRALKGHSYEISLPRGKPLKFTEKSNKEQKVIIKAESSTVGDTESESRGESTMTKSGKTDNQEKKTHKKSSNMPDFGEIYGILRSQFPELVKCMEARKPSKLSKEYLKLRKEDFVQSTRPFSTMCQLEKLVNLGTSVCMVKIGNMQGTGFLLFDNFILTNAHVIEESYDIQSKKLTSAATVNFNMGSGNPLDREFLLSSDVFAVWKGRDDAGRNVDFALLKLQDCEEIIRNEDIFKLPRLLKEYTSNQHAGGICIIGHPCFDVKRINVSCIVPHTETRSASGDSILVSFSFLPDHIQSEYQIEGCNIATYSTYFLKGSSGSPVFDEDCKLVAMHTGGFLTDEIREHAIGFAIPLQSIIKNIIKQLASRESLNVMFRFIETAAQNPHLGEYLKECKEYLKGSEKYLKVFAEVLMRNQSDGNAEMLATIYFETKRNGMLNLFQMIQEALYNNKKYPYVQRIQQKIDLLNRSSQVDELDEEDEVDEVEPMQLSPVRSWRFPS